MPNKNKTPPNAPNAPKNGDISKTFFALCNELKVGELVTTPSFRLADVMSAIELAEPKMDVGVGSSDILTLDQAIEKGVFADDYSLVLSILDATLAMVVGWLEGSSLASTVWSNILVTESYGVKHNTYRPFVDGVNLLVRNIHALVGSVGNIEELPEDFNPHSIFQNTKFAPREVIVTELRKRSHELTTEGENFLRKRLNKHACDLCLAIATRLEVVASFLDVFGYLVPPDIEDPHFHQKYPIINYVNKPKPEKKEVKEARETKDTKEATDGQTENVEEDEESLDDEEYLEDEEDDNSFIPNFRDAITAAERLLDSTRAVAKTTNFGKRSPNGVDGDYTWLPCFDQKACINFIPACFPRSVNIPSRKDAAEWLVRCAHRVADISVTTPNTTRDLNNLFYYARTFTLTGCVLTRSLLQIVMFPADNHLCGNPARTVAAPIEESLRSQYQPQILIKSSPVSTDSTAQELYLRFLNFMVKASISVYTSLGCNLSRQRDRLELAIEELGSMQVHAMRVEERIDDVMLETKMVERREDNISFNSISTFVFHNMVAVIHHYFELGFRMDLYVPYEFTYIYWFLSEVESKWMLTTMERSHEVQYNTWRADPLSTSVDKRHAKEKARKEEELRRRLKTNQCGIINQYAIGQLCDGIVKMTVALIRIGKIKVPPGGEAAERLRFERRMEPFERLGPPIYVAYEDFKYRSNVDKFNEMDLKELLKEANQNFTNAAVNIEKLESSGEINLFVRDYRTPDTYSSFRSLLQVAKANVIASRLLSMDTPFESVQFAFSIENPMFPAIKITRK